MEIFESGQDYLERILILSQKLQKVRSIDIVKDMGFSKPSVSIAMKRLKEAGYINISNDGVIVLTPLGEEIASKIYERHVVISKLLIKLGISEETAMKDACKIEHDLSEETFIKLKELIKD